MTRFCLATVLSFWLPAVDAFGGQAPNIPGEKLTLQQALDLADNNNPQLKASTAQIEAAQAGITGARAHPNPEFGFMAGAQSYRVPGNVAGFVSSYSVAQPLELGKLRESRLEFARRGVDSSQTALALTRLAVLSAVRRAFYQVLRKKSEITIQAEALKLVEDLRQRIQVRVEVGEAGRLELIRAEAEVATARSAANSARLEEIRAMSFLRAAIGTTLPPGIALEGEVDGPVTLPPLDDLRHEVLDHHPSAVLARSEVRRAEARLNYEVALRRPQPAVVAAVDVPPDTPTYRAGIEIPLPFWNRREGPIAEAAAQVKQANSLAQSRELELLAAIEGAYGRYELSTQQLAAFEQGVLLEGREALRAAETAYQLGERGILEVLDAQRVLRTVRLDYLNAQFDRQAALIDLDELRAIELRRNRP